VAIVVAVAWPSAAAAQSTIALKGAGATFPAPIYAKWIANYARREPTVAITYDAIGSEGGVRRLLAGAVDFGACDHPEVLRGLREGNDNRDMYLLVPTVIGAVVPIVNLPGVANDVVLTPDVLSAIYLGDITKWSDPRIRQANHRLRLPDASIVVVHRAEGSGTSYTWTDYLSKTDAQWRSRVGVALSPNWPVGRAASGNDGVAKAVAETAGAIGYVQFIYAVQAHLSYARVRNRRGETVTASLESIRAAADSADLDFERNPSIVDAPGAGAYPIASFTWLVVPAPITDAGKRTALVAFLQWMLTSGQRQAAALGYLPLPTHVITKASTIVAQIRGEP
jgi:phosphate transport system substrate-binding protein